MSTTSTGSSSHRNRRDGLERREAVRAELARWNVRPRKRWGQSFLVDPFIGDAEAALVRQTTSAPLLEVGGGLGVLTEALLRRGFRRLTVIERDRRLAHALRHRVGDRVRVVEGDALATDWESPSALVSNFPFSVATPLLFRAFELGVPEVVGLIQREVAERLAAGPGSRSYGRLSVVAALYGSVELFQVVSPDSFEPEPAVESRLFRFERRATPLPIPSVEAFESLLSAMFTGRRKQLKNLVSRVVRPPAEPRAVAQAAGWPRDWATKRPEEIPPELYFALARVLAERS